MERQRARKPERDEYALVLADFERRATIWAERAAECRRAWEEASRASEQCQDLAENDPLRTLASRAAEALEDLLAELESTAAVAREEVAAWRRHHHAA